MSEKYTQADLFEARVERDKGIKTAVDHADDVVPNWSSMALGYVKRYCALERSSVRAIEGFVTNELRQWAEENGLEEPTTRMAWGSVMVQAKKAGYIRKLGFTQGVYPDRKNTHMQTVTLWEAV